MLCPESFRPATTRCEARGPDTGVVSLAPFAGAAHATLSAGRTAGRSRSRSSRFERRAELGPVLAACSAARPRPRYQPAPPPARRARSSHSRRGTVRYCHRARTTPPWQGRSRSVDHALSRSLQRCRQRACPALRPGACRTAVRGLLGLDGAAAARLARKARPSWDRPDPACRAACEDAALTTPAEPPEPYDDDIDF